MDPITAGIVAGGVGLAGNFMQNQMSTAQAQKQMDFQERMSDTAHQREVSDLRAAGLNPILSALGSGASTPGGASAPIADFGGSLSTGAKIAQQQQAQNATVKNLSADTSNKFAQQALIENQSSATAKDIEQKALQNNLLKQTLPSMVKKAKVEGDYSEINALLGAINSGVNSASKIMTLPESGLLKTMKGK